MKTKELIRQLKEADPSGECECVVGNVDILYVGGEPGYWDGWYEVLIRDENEEGYNVIGARVTNKGTKISIETHSIEWAILDDPELPVYVDDNEERYVDRYEKIRLDTRVMLDELCHFMYDRGLVYIDFSEGKWGKSIPIRKSLTYGV
jgi:hypothetical protein